MKKIVRKGRPEGEIPPLHKRNAARGRLGEIILNALISVHYCLLDEITRIHTQAHFPLIKEQSSGHLSQCRKPLVRISAYYGCAGG